MFKLKSYLLTARTCKIAILFVVLALQGLNMSIVTGLMRSLQINIQQKSDVNKRSLQLSIPTG